MGNKRLKVRIDHMSAGADCVHLQLVVHGPEDAWTQFATCGLPIKDLEEVMLQVSGAHRRARLRD